MLKKKFFFPFWNWPTFFAIVFVSCSSTKNPVLTDSLHQSNCNKQEDFNYTPDQLPNPVHSLRLDTVLTNNFSFKAINVANALQIIEPLIEYLYAIKSRSEDQSMESRMRYLELRQEIFQNINMSSLEISAMASEMDCEEERVDQIAGYLKNKEDKRETNLTVAAIVIGATGAIVAGALLISNNDNNAAEFVGIGTGLIEATLGVFILTNKRKVEFKHYRNALGEIWNPKETSTIFPPSIWYYLNYENPMEDNLSIRKQIVERWKSFDQLSVANDKEQDKLRQLFFGVGGKYTSEQLHNRANMYDQIEANINLMNQDLKNLADELKKFELVHSAKKISF